MDNFTCIYKILKTLEKAMDYSQIDVSKIGWERLGITKERWTRYIKMMNDEGLIKDINIKTYTYLSHKKWRGKNHVILYFYYISIKSSADWTIGVTTSTLLYIGIPVPAGISLPMITFL